MKSSYLNLLLSLVWISVSLSGTFSVEDFSIYDRIPTTISLNKLNIFEDAITLSGFSAGSSMATQLHVAHSKLFHGVALFSQVFYRCGPSSLAQFGLQCSTTGLGIFPYSVNRSIWDVYRYAGQGLVDPIQYLGGQRVFIWTGESDEFIPPDMAEQNKDFYGNFSTNPQELISLTVVNGAKHLMPTRDFGAGCDEDASENVYLGNCNYSGAYHALEFLLRDKTRVLLPPLTLSGNDEEVRGQLLTYNQSEFYGAGVDIREVAMGSLGFIYIPSKCNPTTKCYLHFNFLGCNEWRPELAHRFILNSGFLPVAEQNNIIVIFPLTTKVPRNMGGCWDFFSYTGRHFATKEGGQIKVVRAIIQRVLHGF